MFAAGELDRNAAGVDLDRLRASAIRDSAGSSRGARFERGDEMAVLDIIAEGVEADLGGGKADLRRADQPSRVIDDAHDAQRRRVGAAGFPHPERFERRDRAGEQRGGAMVRLRRRGDEHGVDAGAGKRNRRRQPRRPAADDRHLGRDSIAVRTGNHQPTSRYRRSP